MLYFTMRWPQVCGLKARDFVHTFEDAPPYSNTFRSKLITAKGSLDIPTMKNQSEVKDDILALL